MEWAYELINGYKRGDARIEAAGRDDAHDRRPDRQPRRLQRLARGRRAAGRAATAAAATTTQETVNIVAHPNEYRRKNCRLVDRQPRRGNCVQPAFGLASPGVDPNRNYGGFWGGPGASGDPTNETYYGPGPFSEPETKNVRDARLGAPGDDADHQPHVLEPRAAPAGPRSPGPARRTRASTRRSATRWPPRTATRASSATSSTTRPATTEDWSYYATGGLGFTFEIGAARQLPPAVRRDGRGVRGHDRGVRRATAATAAATARPTSSRRRTPPTRASTPCSTGAAPAGAVLRLSKTFETPTSQKNADGTTRTFEDTLDTTMKVGPDSGTLRLAHQPVDPAARRAGARPRGRPARRARRSSSAARGDRGAVRELRRPAGRTCYNDHADHGAERRGDRQRQGDDPHRSGRRSPATGT